MGSSSMAGMVRMVKEGGEEDAGRSVGLGEMTESAWWMPPAPKYLATA